MASNDASLLPEGHLHPWLSTAPGQEVGASPGGDIGPGGWIVHVLPSTWLVIRNGAWLAPLEVPRDINSTFTITQACLCRGLSCNLHGVVLIPSRFPV